MGLLFWAISFDFFGKILLVLTALLVHKRVRMAHRIDKKVLKEMKLEQGVGIISMFFLLTGYILHLIAL